MVLVSVESIYLLWESLMTSLTLRQLIYWIPSRSPQHLQGYHNRGTSFLMNYLLLPQILLTSHLQSLPSLILSYQCPPQKCLLMQYSRHNTVISINLLVQLHCLTHLALN